jgi:hypothetical protein
VKICALKKRPKQDTVGDLSNCEKSIDLKAAREPLVNMPNPKSVGTATPGQLAKGTGTAKPLKSKKGSGKRKNDDSPPTDTVEEGCLTTPTKKTKTKLFNAGREGLMPKMDEDDIEQLATEDSKVIVKMLNQLGEFFQNSVESIKSSHASALSLTASPTSPAGNFDTVWKNYMGYCLLHAIPVAACHARSQL